MNLRDQKKRRRMMTEQVKWGILGYARIAGMSVIPATLACGNSGTRRRFRPAALLDKVAKCELYCRFLVERSGLKLT
jgi:hypothetical protein